MLNEITNHFNLISKVSSFGGKILAISMTGFGLKKLWTQEAKQKFSLPTRIAFSSTYVLHMGATSIAVATCFGASPVSAPIATALVGATSMLTSFSNLMEAYISHSMLTVKYSALEKQLKAKNIDLQRTIALNENANECETHIKSLSEQITQLQIFHDNLTNIQVLPHLKHYSIIELKTAYLALEEMYTENTKKNKVIGNYFKRNAHKNSLSKIHDKIDKIRTQVEQILSNLKTQKNEKTRTRLQQKIALLEPKSQKWGMINIQSIKYKKIEDQINQLETLLCHVEINNEHTKNPIHIIEKKYLENRIKTLKSTLVNWGHLHEDGQTLDLEIGIVDTLDERIIEAPKKFKFWLLANLKSHIDLLENQIEELERNTEQVQKYFRAFIKSPILDIPKQRLAISQIEKEMVALKSDLSLEKLNEESKKKKVNLSTVTSVIALSLCVIPHADAINVMKKLMLGFGILGSVSSLWDFYNRNLLVKKVESQIQLKIQRLNKELQFRTIVDKKTTPRLNLEDLLGQTLKMHLFKLKDTKPLPLAVTDEIESPIISKPTIRKITVEATPQNRELYIRNAKTLLLNRRLKRKGKPFVNSVKTKPPAMLTKNRL